MLFEVKGWKFATKALPVAENADQGKPPATTLTHANNGVAPSALVEAEQSSSKKKRRKKSKGQPTAEKQVNIHTESSAVDSTTSLKDPSCPSERHSKNGPVKRSQGPTSVTKPKATKPLTQGRASEAPTSQCNNASYKTPRPKRKHTIVADPPKSEPGQDFKRNRTELSTSSPQADLPRPSFGSASGSMSKLQAKMASKLRGARFRWINEQLYTTRGEDAFELFQSQPEIFDEYHEGFQSQVKSWPTNPVDLYIKALRKLPSSLVIADMGCGEAKVAQSVKQTVHSFDLVAANAHITACNIAHTPLPDDSADIVIFCLSLMGTNHLDFLQEARRIVKPNRFTDIDAFVQVLDELGFKLSVKVVHQQLINAPAQKSQDRFFKTTGPTA
ncbi:25S rRNA (adenine645-N1)-methyltransferase [Dimargaris xerosporica]|nr:25S rRNA (adenine645-N1)-methyltransferase [Dimargaris xerosporica]